MGQKSNLADVCELIKFECDSIIESVDKEDIYKGIDNIVYLLFLMLNASKEIESVEVFPYFTQEEISEKNIDFTRNSDTIKSKNNFDGGFGSGHKNHSGVPGKQGGSAPKGSERGENKPCVGFSDSEKLKKHHSKHGTEYPGMSTKDYESHAIKFLEQPCGGDIDGYITQNNEIVRFNTKTGEFAKGIPGGELITCFFAKYNAKKGTVDIAKANNYFNNCKKNEGV